VSTPTLGVTRLALPEVLAIQPRRFVDARGSFVETWRESHSHNPASAASESDSHNPGPAPSESPSHNLAPAVPRLGPFLQDNASVSHRGVLRGLHFQWPHPQGKLLTVLSGAILDAVVDVRRGSPTFGVGLTLEVDAAGPQLWIPPGFAHGFLALEDQTVVIYKCTTPRVEAAERRILWSDPALALAWPTLPTEPPRLSDLDARAPRLADLPDDALPVWDGA
jgi:dTDP-4-dehydrorhamnose 3,5-epimerase